jgi:hypothetical protein
MKLEAYLGKSLKPLLLLGFNTMEAILQQLKNLTEYHYSERPIGFYFASGLTGMPVGWG